MSSDSSPIYFWRVNEEPYGCFSQWYSSTFAVPAPASAGEDAAALTFRTAEQYMMYHKAILFNDQKIADEIIRESNPRKQKALGRRVRGFDEEMWNKHREKIVEEGNWWKFTQSKNGGLKSLLLETVDRELIEASPYDSIWGIGFSAANAGVNTDNWGENLLGKALMRVRDRLQTEVESACEQRATPERSYER